MPYISSGGRVAQSRPLLRASLPMDILYGILNFITMFFGSLFSPQSYSSGYSSSEYSRMNRNGGDDGNMFGGDRARGRRGGFRRNTGPAPPPMGGG